MKLKYNGTDERVFPSLGITVKPGDEFDAPEGFTLIAQHQDQRSQQYQHQPQLSLPRQTPTLRRVNNVSTAIRTLVPGYR